MIPTFQMKTKTKTKRKHTEEMRQAKLVNGRAGIRITGAGKNCGILLSN